MKSSLAFLLVLFLEATSGSAQSRGMVEFTPVGGPYQSEHGVAVFVGCQVTKGTPGPCVYPYPSSGTKNPLIFGGRLTVWLAPPFALEGSLMGSPQSMETPVFASVRGVLKFAPRSRLSAYALGGPALVTFDDAPLTFGGVLGVGASFHIVRSLALRAEFERYLYADDQWLTDGYRIFGEHKNTFMTLGLSVALRHGNRDEGSDVPER